MKTIQVDPGGPTVVAMRQEIDPSWENFPCRLETDLPHGWARWTFPYDLEFQVGRGKDAIPRRVVKGEAVCSNCFRDAYLHFHGEDPYWSKGDVSGKRRNQSDKEADRRAGHGTRLDWERVAQEERVRRAQ